MKKHLLISGFLLFSGISYSYGALENQPQQDKIKTPQQSQEHVQELPDPSYAYGSFFNCINNLELMQLYFFYLEELLGTDINTFFTPIFNNAFLRVYPSFRDRCYQQLRATYINSDSNPVPGIQCIGKILDDIDINNLQNYSPQGDENLVMFL